MQMNRTYKYNARVDVCRKRARGAEDAIIPKSVRPCTTNCAEPAEKLILSKYFRNGEQFQWKHAACI